MSDPERPQPLSSFLASTPIFAGLASDDLVAVAESVREVEVDAGESLMTQGHAGHAVAIVLDGTIEVRRDGEVVEVMGAGAVVGEVAVLTEGRRNATVIARTHARVGIIEETALRSLVQAIPVLAERFGALVRIRAVR